MHKANGFAKVLTVVLIVAMSVSPAYFLGEGSRNLLLIGIMCFSPFVILRYLEFSITDLLLMLFMVMIALFPLLDHPETMRWTTVMFTYLFCLNFMAYSRLLRHSGLNVRTYSKVIKYLIYAYAVVLLVQQFCVLTGLPIFNVSNYNVLEPWKLNSLTSEPSHSARFMGLLMYSYLLTKELITGRGYDIKLDSRGDSMVWLCFLWTMLTMVSATAFLFLFIVMTKLIKGRNIFYLAVATVMLIVVADSLEIKAFERMTKVAKATLTLDEEKIIEADHSGSFRIVPFLLSAKEVDLSTTDGWFGKGIDYMSTILYKKIPGTPRGYSNGGMMVVAAEYGFLAFIIMLIFSLKVCINKKDITSWLFWLFMVFTITINMQIFWCAMLFLYTNKYFVRIGQDQLIDEAALCLQKS